MTSTYRKLRIFVGCPSDIAVCRNITEETAKSLQAIANNHGLELEIAHWGHVPANAGRPQDVIFKHFPPETWDVFIGILWHRFGTAPGAKDPITGKDYEGGTEEEFRRGYDQLRTTGEKPKIKVYFCNKDIPRKGFDTIQFEKVEAFKKEIQAPGSAYESLTVDFTNEEEFRNKILHDLQHIIIELGEIPDNVISTSPPQTISNLPARTAFFGREADLATVRAAIDKNSTDWGILIDAIGGTGKTALAIEAAHRAMDDGLFKACVFVTAKQSRLEATGAIPQDADALAVDDFINETARALGQPGIAQLEPKEKKQALFTVLKQLPTLLVYDNLETLTPDQQETIEHFMCALPTGSKAILTSRRTGAGTGRHLSLGRLEWAAAEQIIEKEAQKDNSLALKLNKHRERWQELYNETYGSPLALIHLLGLMRVKRRLDIDAALELLKTKTGIEARIDFMFSEARKELTATDITVVCALSFFVPSADITALMAITGFNEAELNDALDHLDKLCLLDTLTDTGRYTLHPLTREFAQKEIQADAGVAYEIGLSFAQYWLNYSEKYGGDNPESYKTYPLLETEWANIEATMNWLWLATGTKDDSIENEYCARMLNSMATVLRQFLLYAGRWDERIILSERAYIAMKLLQDESPAGWRAYNAAFIFQQRGNITSAEAWCHKAIAAWNLAGNKREEAAGMQMSGGIAQEKRAFDEAEKYLTSALNIYRELDDKNAIPTVLSDLAILYLAQQRYNEAETYFKEAAATTTNIGSKALYLSNLGILEGRMKNWEAAKSWYEQALVLAEQTKRQEIIATCLHGLARSAAAIGAFEEAHPLAERALYIREKLQDIDLQITRSLIAHIKENIAAQQQNNPTTNA